VAEPERAAFQSISRQRGLLRLREPSDLRLRELISSITWAGSVAINVHFVCVTGTTRLPFVELADSSARGVAFAACLRDGFDRLPKLYGRPRFFRFARASFQN